jgi:hypothetical protein
MEAHSFAVLNHLILNDARQVIIPVEVKDETLPAISTGGGRSDDLPSTAKRVKRETQSSTQAGVRQVESLLCNNVT